MKDWVILTTAFIQMLTALTQLTISRKTKKKGTNKRRGRRKRK